MFADIQNIDHQRATSCAVKQIKTEGARQRRSGITIPIPRPHFVRRNGATEALFCCDQTTNVDTRASRQALWEPGLSGGIDGVVADHFDNWWWTQDQASGIPRWRSSDTEILWAGAFANRQDRESMASAI